MAEIQVTIDGDAIQEILGSDRGLAVLVERALNQVLEHEITEHVGAKKHERTPGRRGRRNGRYRRRLTTRVGTIELEVPRDRAGTFRTALFERYQRSEKALVLALMEMVVNGVSTRKVKKITAELCGREFTRSTVSELAKELDVQVEAWNERPLEGRYPFVLVDAMQIRVRREGAVRSTSALLVVGVSETGYREVLGIRIADSESEAGWLETFRWLKERGLSGVDLVVSDAHAGLVRALRRCFQGAVWQRCQAHFRRNVLDRTPVALKDPMARALDRILGAEDPNAARAAFRAFAEEIDGQGARALETLESGLEDAIAVLGFPEKYRRRLRTTNMLERLIEELRRRERVIRIFPNERSAWRLLGAFLVEVHESWSTGWRYLKMDDYDAWKENREDDAPTERAA